MDSFNHTLCILCLLFKATLQLGVTIALSLVKHGQKSRAFQSVWWSAPQTLAHSTTQGNTPNTVAPPLESAQGKS